MRKFCGIKVFFDRFFPPNDRRRFTAICRREKCGHSRRQYQSHHVQEIGDDGGENVVEREIIDQKECCHVPDQQGRFVTSEEHFREVPIGIFETEPRVRLDR